jgi:hypothetical protein
MNQIIAEAHSRAFSVAASLPVKRLTAINQAVVFATGQCQTSF